MIIRIILRAKYVQLFVLMAPFPVHLCRLLEAIVPVFGIRPCDSIISFHITSHDNNISHYRVFLRSKDHIIRTLPLITPELSENNAYLKSVNYCAYVHTSRLSTSNVIGRHSHIQ
ncbi:hypothetical protein BDB01DRAFT_895531 [Pilobolus umbonatus]|nr:hypothetical protein BDB01DRAFT_895531 [Pilobolus umbonatus]